MDARKNLAVSTVATAPSPATSGTSLVVASGHGTRFPATPFNAVICPAGTQPDPSNAEIVRVTAISTDTFTITRAQEGTTARTVVVGDQIFQGITALTFTDIENLLPWFIPLDLAVPAGLTGFSSGYIGDASVADYLNGSAQNDELHWDVVLAAGTWTFKAMFLKRSSSGIITLNFDGSSQGTIDTYTAGSTNGAIGTITGISVATTAKVTVQIKAATKNASSSGYNLFVARAALIRTA